MPYGALGLGNALMSFIESPLGVTLIGVALGALLTIAGAAVKIVIDVSSLKRDISYIREQMEDIKSDDDIMRWSDYGKSQTTERGIRLRRGGR